MPMHKEKAKIPAKAKATLKDLEGIVKSMPKEAVKADIKNDKAILKKK